MMEDMEGFRDALAAVNEKISTVQMEITDLMTDCARVREEVRSELAAAGDRLRRCQSTLAKEAVKESTEKRIGELKADAKNAAEALESIESMLFAIEEFVRFKARFVEGSINDLFRLATFRLFREQANGGLEERCDVVYDGVPFMGLNNGMKVNVGIDIINALSRHYGVTVPLFVDNAESVTNLEHMINACASSNTKLAIFPAHNESDVMIDQARGAYPDLFCINWKREVDQLINEGRSRWDFCVDDGHMHSTPLAGYVAAMMIWRAIYGEMPDVKLTKTSAVLNQEWADSILGEYLESPTFELMDPSKILFLE